LERDVQGLAWHNLGGGVAVGGGGDTEQVGGVADHVGIAELVTSGLGQLVPDVEPVNTLPFSRD